MSYLTQYLNEKAKDKVKCEMLKVIVECEKEIGEKW